MLKGHPVKYIAFPRQDYVNEKKTGEQLGQSHVTMSLLHPQYSVYICPQFPVKPPLIRNCPLLQKRTPNNKRSPVQILARWSHSPIILQPSKWVIYRRACPCRFTWCSWRPLDCLICKLRMGVGGFIIKSLLIRPNERANCYSGSAGWLTVPTCHSWTDYWVCDQETNAAP